MGAPLWVERLSCKFTWILAVAIFLLVAGCTTSSDDDDSSGSGSCSGAAAEENEDNAGVGTDNVVIDDATYTEGADGSVELENDEGDTVVYCDPSVSAGYDAGLDQSYVTLVVGFPTESGADPEVFFELYFEGSATGTFDLAGSTLDSMEYGTAADGFCDGTAADSAGDGVASVTISTYGAVEETIEGELTLTSFDTDNVDGCATIPTDPIAFVATRHSDF